MPTPYPEGAITPRMHEFTGSGDSTVVRILDVRHLIHNLRYYVSLGLSCEQVNDLFLANAFTGGTIYAMPGSVWNIDNFTLSSGGARENGPVPISAECETTTTAGGPIVTLGGLVGEYLNGELVSMDGSIVLNFPDDMDIPAELPAPGFRATVSAPPVFGQTFNLVGSFEVIDSVSPEFLGIVVPACNTGPGPDPEPTDEPSLIDKLIGIKLANLNPPRFPFDRYPSNLK